jgi:hypothetical protein
LLVLTGPALLNPNPTNILFSVTGNTLYLSWPADHLGWSLQSNSVSVVASNGWFAYPNSTNMTNVGITINRSKTNVFFRLANP